MKGTLGRGMRVASAALVLVAVVGAASGCGGSSGEASLSASGSSGVSGTGFVGGDAVPPKPAAPIRLTDYRGHEVNLADLKGRPVLVAFLYTHCPDLCPLVGAKIHTTYSLLAPHAARPVFLAVSVDPARDTPASAAKFNREHRTGGEIDWLLGSRSELEKVWKAWHVVPERERKNPEVIEHSADIYGIGANGSVEVLYPPEFKPALLARDVQTLAGS